MPVRDIKIGYAVNHTRNKPSKFKNKPSPAPVKSRRPAIKLNLDEDAKDPSLTAGPPGTDQTGASFLNNASTSLLTRWAPQELHLGATLNNLSTLFARDLSTAIATKGMLARKLRKQKPHLAATQTLKPPYTALDLDEAGRRVAAIMKRREDNAITYAQLIKKNTDFAVLGKARLTEDGQWVFWEDVKKAFKAIMEEVWEVDKMFEEVKQEVDWLEGECRTLQEVLNGTSKEVKEVRFKKQEPKKQEPKKQEPKKEEPKKEEPKWDSNLKFKDTKPKKKTVWAALDLK